MSAVTFTIAELDTMSYRDMQSACKTSGIKATGKGDELRQRLSALLSTVLSDSTNISTATGGNNTVLLPRTSGRLSDCSRRCPTVRGVV